MAISPKPISSFNVDFWLANMPNTSRSRIRLSLPARRPPTSLHRNLLPLRPRQTRARARPAAPSDTVPCGAAASPQLRDRSRGRREAGPGTPPSPFSRSLLPRFPSPGPQAPVRTFPMDSVRRKPHTHRRSSIIGGGPRADRAQSPVTDDGG